MSTENISLNWISKS